MDVDSRIDAIVESCKNSEYSQNPVQILKYLQQKLITGRPLEILDPTSSEKQTLLWSIVRRFWKHGLKKF